MSGVAARAPGRRLAGKPRPSYGGWDLYSKRNPSQILLWDGLISNPRYHPYSEDRMSMSSALEPPVCRRMHPLTLHVQHLYLSYGLMLPAVFAEDSDAEIHSAGQHRPLSRQAALFG